MGTREIRTATFAGREYRYVVHDVESIREQPGVERLAGVASHPEGASHATWGTFVDEAEVRERHWHPEPGDVVLDVGPAFGSYTLTAALLGAHVFAFEPCEFCRAILAQNVEANEGNLPGTVTIVPVGVHERHGWFEPNEGKLHDEPGGERLRVESLDELAKHALLRHERVDWVKLDVEGAELGAVLSGAKLLATRPHLLVEEHEFKQAGIGAAVEEVLRGHGYGPPVRVPHGAVNHAFYEGLR